MGFKRKNGSGSRSLILQIALVALFLVYTARLFSMQIFSGDIYRSRARNIARQTTVILAQRGEIYDRHFNQPLVVNTDSFAVSITPGEIPASEIPEIKRRLAAVLDIRLEQIERRIPRSAYHIFQPVEIAVNVPFTTIAALAEQAFSFPGVSWQSRPMRSYRDIGSLSHIIGFTGSITRDELMVLHNLGYKPGDIIGKSGIERQYDELLRGREGWETRTVDARGRNVAGEKVRAFPQMGKTLALTIDRRIQTLAENALGRRIGAVVVLRPASGEILAMVSYPWYDPNIFNQTDIGPAFQTLVNNPNRPFINRAIQSSYPAGSSFKIVMSAAILAENVFPPDQTILCQGEMPLGDRVWRCIRRTVHGRINLQGALAQSCNIYYGIVARDHLGAEHIVNHTRDFGFGVLTGIDLPGEVSGFVPTPQWKERRLHEPWMGGDTMNLSVGQGYFLTTPLQMANMVAMVVNDGLIFAPHILKEVRDPISGVIEMSATPRVLHKSNIQPEVFEQVRQDMRSVITVGTAQYPLNIRTVEIAGKTGTAEVGLENNWHSWFVAYAPFETDNPDEKIVVSVIVEAINEWEWWAPYCSAIIFQGIFANQTYEEAIHALRLHNNRPL
jgi:penicillin-binding protein 2